MLLSLFVNRSVRGSWFVGQRPTKPITALYDNLQFDSAQQLQSLWLRSLTFDGFEQHESSRIWRTVSSWPGATGGKSRWNILSKERHLVTAVDTSHLMTLYPAFPYPPYWKQQFVPAWLQNWENIKGMVPFNGAADKSFWNQVWPKLISKLLSALSHLYSVCKII